MIAALAAIGSFLLSLGSSAAALLGIEAVKFTAQKAFWMFLVSVVLPILLYNVCVMVVTSFLSGSLHVVEAVANPDSMSLHLTGMAGWIANQIYLPQAVSTYMSAVGVRVIIQFIPFAPK